MKNIFFLALIILLLTHCSEKEQPNDISEDTLIASKIDSSSYFITDTSVYNFMLQIVDKIIGDSNSLDLIPLPVDISTCGFDFKDAPDNSYKKQNDDLKQFTIEQFIGTKKDSIYIDKQLNQHKGKHWIAEKVKQSPHKIYYSSMYLKRENGAFDWDKFKKDGHGCYVALSIPIFNTEHNKAVIKTSSVCRENAGAGYTYWFEKKENKWIIVSKWQDWIS
ncbi:MAG: hypothetical protein ACK5Z2_16480 [Bacteroidota bacterium]|jgi:hypothetical protein